MEEGEGRRERGRRGKAENIKDMYMYMHIDKIGERERGNEGERQRETKRKKGRKKLHTLYSITNFFFSFFAAYLTICLYLSVVCLPTHAITLLDEESCITKHPREQRQKDRETLQIKKKNTTYIL